MTSTFKKHSNVEIDDFDKYNYNSLGQKIQLDDPDLGTWKYGYDFAGNLISQTGGGGNLITGDSYYREYNGLGQMIRVRGGNNATAPILEEYFYDSSGDRIKINRYSYSGGTNETIYTPYKEWMQIRNSSGTFNFYYIYQGDTLVARKNADGTTYYYHPDHLGSTNLITDENGNVVENEFYSPFGESLSPNNAEENKLYTGQFKDSIENQYYYGTRYYNLFIGRFIQCDKLKPYIYNPQNLNCYSYGLNNPFKYFDWNGNVAVLFEGGYTPSKNRDSVGVVQIYQQLDSDVQKVSQVFDSHATAQEGYNFIKESIQQNANQPIVIIGHSRGAGKALEVQQMLQDEGIAVDLAFTIDPLSFDDNHKELFKSPPTVKGVNTNYYAPATGLELTGAENIFVFSHHWNIDSNRKVQNQIVSRTNSAHYQYWNRFSSSGGLPIASSDGIITLGSGGQSGSFKCYATSCSATPAYIKPKKPNPTITH